MSPFFDLKIKDKKNLNKAAKLLHQARKNGKVFFKAAGKKGEILRGAFSSEKVKGQKGVFLSNFFAGKRLKFENDRPVFVGKGVKYSFFPAPDNLEALIPDDYDIEPNGDITGDFDELENAVADWVNDEIPDGDLYGISFGGVDYMKGANTDDKQALIDEILELLKRVISSSPSAIDFFDGVFVIDKA